MKNNYRKTSCIRSKKQISNYVLLLVVLLMSSSSLKAQVPSYVPTNGLVGWWPFNGNANDESGNGNNGTVNGATLTSDRFGNLNSSYSFNGLNNEIEVLNNIQLNILPLTISVWFKTSFNTLVSPLVNKYPCATYNGYSLHLKNGNPAVFYFGSISSISTKKIDYDPIPVGISLYNNLWHNLVYSIDTTGVKYYLDGNLLYNGGWINGIGLTTTTNEKLHFGKYPSGLCSSDIFYNGQLDDISIWNRALTQQEITALYNGCQLSINSQPTNQTIIVNNNAQFIVSSSDPNATYQWQTNLGIGFQNLSSVGQYSGATNDTLTVSYVTFANNNQPFRCIVSSGSCYDTSNVAVLTVNNNVGINEISQNQLFSVYPNPTSTVINLKSDAQLLGATYFIYDNLGKIILSGKVTSENTSIDLDQLADGNYLIGIESNGFQSKKQSFKVIK